jgi:DNA/RNA-binding domain of Phe-tRNA-synthetase-like protein
MFEISEIWQKTYPTASVGVLAMHGVENPELSPALEIEKEHLEIELRTTFAGRDRQALKSMPVMQCYAAYLKPYNKNYHVFFQLESVALKGKPIPRVAALVETMFMAELKTQLLTAVHDMDRLILPVSLEIAIGSESYLTLNGQDQVLKAGDMFIADRLGIISSIIYGPDSRTSITPATTRVLFTTYAPPGIFAAQVADNLDCIEGYVRLISPGAITELKQVFEAQNDQNKR